MSKITIKEIAKECGVSPSTVSNVINSKSNKVSEETRKRILEAMERAGYQPNNIAQGLRRKRTQTIGIIVEDIAQFTTPLIVEGVMEVCEEKGYKTVVQNLRLYSRWQDLWFDNSKMVESVLRPAIQELKNIMVDGIIYIAGHSRHMVFPEEINVPVVLCYTRSETRCLPSVVLDDEESAYLIMKYIIGKGHRNIGIIAGEKDNLHSMQRLKGCQRAFKDAGIEFQSEKVVFAGWNKEHGYKSTEYFINMGVSAVMCMNDRLAGGLYQYCYENNIKIGKDISVTGFDNELLAECYTPGLTTVEIPLVKLGGEAMRLLFEMTAEKEAEQEEAVAAEAQVGMESEVEKEAETETEMEAQAEAQMEAGSKGYEHTKEPEPAPCIKVIGSVIERFSVCEV